MFYDATDYDALYNDFLNDLIDAIVSSSIETL